ncbi:hypothetical protein Bbelb_004010 [Branchiostoma belcheri]|nr:hypothetical protein Bbelb_004010 [Branchiostoma belcheri]
MTNDPRGRHSLALVSAAPQEVRIYHNQNYSSSDTRYRTTAATQLVRVCPSSRLLRGEDSVIVLGLLSNWQVFCVGLTRDPSTVSSIFHAFILPANELFDISGGGFGFGCRQDRSQ